MAASITVNLDDAAELILNDLTAERNAVFPDVLSPAQFLRQFVRDYLRSQSARLDENKQLSLREAFRQATPAEQAQINAILDQYR